MKIRFFLVLITAFTIYNTLNAQNVPLIYKINLKKEIGSTSWIYVRNGLNEAVKSLMYYPAYEHVWWCCFVC